MYKVPNCDCENEAKVIYEMCKKLGTLQDGTWQTNTCCSDAPATLVISGKSCTITYADGSSSSYIDMYTTA